VGFDLLAFMALNFLLINFSLIWRAFDNQRAFGGKFPQETLG
jgi:hypothetical protein